MSQKVSPDQVAIAQPIDDLNSTLSVLQTIDTCHPHIRLIQEAIRLKMNKTFYVFHKYDEITRDYGWGNFDGIGIYERNGNALKEHFNEENLPTSEWAIQILKNLSVWNVYTWNIEGEFLSLEAECTVEADGDGDIDRIIQHDILLDSDIENFWQAWIKVQILSLLE